MEQFATILILIHATLGGIALLSGAIALVVKKGSPLHKKSGKVFFFAMLVSALTSLVVAVLPNHENPFLFSIGLFSTYFLVSGIRALNLRKSNPRLLNDKIIAFAIIAVGLGMIGLPILLKGVINIVLLVFGLVSLSFGLRDLLLFKNIEKTKKSWLKLHLGKMTGGYISAVTAFLVVNNLLPGIWNWFVPGIAGTVYITYWMNKVNKAK